VPNDKAAGGYYDEDQESALLICIQYWLYICNQQLLLRSMLAIGRMTE